MQNITSVATDTVAIGASDHRLSRFENIFPIPNGVSYNSYVILDEKTVLIDTADLSIADQFLENLQEALGGKKLDFLVVQHVEPDHSSMIAEIVREYPDVVLYCSKQAWMMINQFFPEIPVKDHVEIKEGDTLGTGTHTLHFVAAPMVHWPEVMVTYDEADKILFSADAFGTFGALNGNLYADQTDIEKDWLPEGRRYYANIVGKYGTQVQTLLNKAAGLEISMICPLHGPIWRSAKKIEWLIGTYAKWATYRAEDHEAVIFYASVYGGTENAAEVLADALGERKVRNIRMYDVSVTDVSYLVSEAFRADHLVFLSTTYNNDIFPAMEFLITDLKAHNLQNRKVALIENGSWAPVAGKKITEYFSGMKNLTVMGSTITMKSTVKEPQRVQLEELADIIAASIDEADRM